MEHIQPLKYFGSGTMISVSRTPSAAVLGLSMESRYVRFQELASHPNMVSSGGLRMSKLEVSLRIKACLLSHEEGKTVVQDKWWHR
jgi:hypothetical protein